MDQKHHGTEILPSGRISDERKHAIALVVLTVLFIAASIVGYLRLVKLEANVALAAYQTAEIIRTRKDFVGEIHAIHADVKWIKQQIGKEKP
jgi:hypothetical protein